jgi:beta-propeller repeat-containing protein
VVYGLGAAMPAAGEAAVPRPGEVRPAAAAAAGTRAGGAKEREAVAASLRALPLGFVRNLGQSDATVRFQAAAPGAGFYATDAGLTVALAAGERTREVLSLRFLGGPNPHPRITASERLAGEVNVLNGRPQRGLTRSGTLIYEQVWPGIDVRFKGTGGVLAYEFLLAPGADPGRIRLAWRGTERLELTADGALSLLTRAGRLGGRAPKSRQGGTQVASRYVLEGGGRLGISVGAHDRSRQLAVTSTLAYWSFLGGTHFDEAFGIAVDDEGAAYVTGQTFSADFPSVDQSNTVPGYDPTYNGNADAFVVKLARSGRTPAYWTFLGGSDYDAALAIAVDREGAAYITGYTGSADFPSGDQPTTFPGYDQTQNGFADAFVVKLSRSGRTLAYWTFLGGSDFDRGFGISVDREGAAYLTGDTFSADFPSVDQTTTFPGYDQTRDGGSDAFVVKLSRSGRTLAYWTFLGGAAEDEGFGIAVDRDGAAYVTGETLSADFPSTDQPASFPGYDQSHDGQFDAFVVKLSRSGRTLAYWTFLGGSSVDVGAAIAVDREGAAYITGRTASTNFPSVDQATTFPGYDQSQNGDFDAFVVKLSRSGTMPAYWTFLGGSSYDVGLAIAADREGAAYITGLTLSADFPSTDQATTFPGYDQSQNGDFDAFVVKLKGPTRA